MLVFSDHSLQILDFESGIFKGLMTLHSEFDDCSALDYFLLMDDKIVLFNVDDLNSVTLLSKHGNHIVTLPNWREYDCIMIDRGNFYLRDKEEGLAYVLKELMKEEVEVLRKRREAE